MKIYHILIATFILLLSGCTNDYSQVKKSDLNSVFIINSSPTFLGYYYDGSDEGFHYFTSKWKYSADKKVKVAKADLDLAREIELGAESITLTLFTMPDAKSIFCKIGERPIYERP